MLIRPTRNAFFLLVAASVLVVGTAPAPAQARTLKIATISPDGTSWMKELRAGGKEIEKRTKGRVKLKFYPGGVMGNEKSMLRKIRMGQLQGGAFTGGGLVEVFSDIQIYSLPFVFRSYQEADYVRAQMDPLIMDGLAEGGLVAMGISEGGFAHLLSNTPLKTREDLIGKKVWIPEDDTMSQIAFETAGISPIQLPIGDVYTALQTGLLDTVASSPIGAIALQWHTKVKYFSDVPLMYLVGALVIDARAFGKLSAEDQAVVREVIGEKFEKIDGQTRLDNENAREALANQGIGFVTPPPGETKRWRAIADEAEVKYREKDLYTPQMYEILMGHLAEFRSHTPDVSSP